MSKKMLYIPTLFFCFAIAPALASANIEGEVKTGNFSPANRQDNPLIGDFKDELINLAKTQLEGAKLVELAAQSFADCELRFGEKELDQARYSECVLEAAQDGRSSYQQLKRDFEKVNNELDKYKNYLEGVSEETKQALQKEQDSARKAGEQVEKAATMLENLIAKVEKADSDAQASLEQKRLQDEVTDLCYHSINMLEMYQQNVARLNADISLYQGLETATESIQYNLNRGLRQINYRQIEADEFIRGVRLYGLNRARGFEGGEIVDLFDDKMMPQILSAIKNIPNYSSAMAQLKNRGKVRKLNLKSPDPQTNGQMLSQLQELLRQMRGGQENG